MNSNRSSRAFTLVVATLLLAATALPAAAVTATPEDVPQSAEVGTEVTATFTLTELYDSYEKWTLNGRTNLTSVTWTVTTYDQAGKKVAQNAYDGSSFNQSISLENGASKVTVTVTGVVPEIENFTYEPAQSFLLAELNQVRTGGSSAEIDSWSIVHYTPESREARTAIDEARAAIEVAKADGANVDRAGKTLQNAIAAYNGENFQLAGNLAAEAKQQAQSAKRSSTTMRMALYGVAAVVALLAIVGAVYWYRSQQDTYDKLG